VDFMLLIFLFGWLCCVHDKQKTINKKLDEIKSDNNNNHDTMAQVEKHLDKINQLLKQNKDDD
jgi:hypothetical protein